MKETVFGLGSVVPMNLNRLCFLGFLTCIFLTEGVCGEEEWILHRRHPLLMESALIEPKGSIQLFTGVEFEEDSGDFPTTKFPVHLQWSVTDRIAIVAGAEPLIFNKGEDWSSGLTNSVFSGLFTFRRPDGMKPAVTLRQDLLVPTGLFSTGKWNTSTYLLFTWKSEQWRFHLNGGYTFGGHDDRHHIMVSEVDRYRAIAGVEFAPQQKPFTLLISFNASKPIRPKPFEPVVELGGRIRLTRSLVVNLGAGRSLKESAGPDYLLRFTVCLGKN